jgi:hypothetical protein
MVNVHIDYSTIWRNFAIEISAAHHADDPLSLQVTAQGHRGGRATRRQRLRRDWASVLRKSSV